LDGGSTIRVLVIDEYPIVRAGLRKIFERERDIVVTGETGTGAEVRGLVAQKSSDVVVLDLNLHNPSGLEVLKEIKREHPGLPVLVVSEHREGQLAVHAFRAGAAGYITRKAPPEEWVEAVRQLIQGRRYVSPAVAEELIGALGDELAPAPHLRLSKREYQVLRLIGGGTSVSQIAKDMRLSVKTISTYRARILEKMGMRSNAELVRYVLRHPAAPARHS